MPLPGFSPPSQQNLLSSISGESINFFSMSIFIPSLPVFFFLNQPDQNWDAFYGFPRWDYWDPSPIPLDLILSPKYSANVAIKLRYFSTLESRWCGTWVCFYSAITPEMSFEIGHSGGIFQEPTIIVCSRVWILWENTKNKLLVQVDSWRISIRMVLSRTFQWYGSSPIVENRFDSRKKN